MDQGGSDKELEAKYAGNKENIEPALLRCGQLFSAPIIKYAYSMLFLRFAM